MNAKKTSYIENESCSIFHFFSLQFSRWIGIIALYQMCVENVVSRIYATQPRVSVWPSYEVSRKWLLDILSSCPVISESTSECTSATLPCNSDTLTSACDAAAADDDDDDDNIIIILIKLLLSFLNPRKNSRGWFKNYE